MGVYGTRDGKFIAKKITVKDKLPVQYIIPKTVAYSTAALMSAEDVHTNGTAAYDNTDLLVQPPYPMTLLVTANVAGTVANTDELVFVGLDAKGAVISESVIISSTAATSVESDNAFAKITSITSNVVVKSTNVGIGYNNAAIGLPYPIASSSDIISYAYDGGFSTAAGATNALDVDGDYNTVTVLGTAAGKVIQVIYKTKLQD